MKKFISLALITAFILSTFSGCKKDKGDPPILPPQESMSMDFTNFTSGKKSLDVTATTQGTANSNWEFAAVVVSVWRVLMTTTLAVPVASFKLASGSTPVYLKDKMWQWTYNSVTLAGVSYNARLTGEIGATDVVWKMYISRTGVGAYSEFLWYQGTSKLNGTSGQWILNQSQTVQDPVLQIDWTKSGDAIGSVKYTYIKNADQFNTSYIEYGLTSNTLDAYFTVHYYNGVKFSDVNIEWSTSLKNGRAKSADYLGDDNWYCCDENRINVTCP